MPSPVFGEDGYMPTFQPNIIDLLSTGWFAEIKKASVIEIATARHSKSSWFGVFHLPHKKLCDKKLCDGSNAFSVYALYAHTFAG